jgi:hypothetical protein
MGKNVLHIGTHTASTVCAAHAPRWAMKEAKSHGDIGDECCVCPRRVRAVLSMMWGSIVAEGGCDPPPPPGVGPRGGGGGGGGGGGSTSVPTGATTGAPAPTAWSSRRSLARHGTAAVAVGPCHVSSKCTAGC